MKDILQGTILGGGRFSPSSVSRRLGPYSLFPLIALLAFVMAYPVFMVVYGSFKGGPPGMDAPFSLDGYIRGWGTFEPYKALILTVGLAVPRTLFGLTLAIVLAWILVRTNTPLRGFLEQALWFKVFLPALPVILAWLLLAGGKAGLLNRFLMNTFDLTRPPLDMRSIWGLLFMSLMFSATAFYLFIAPAFRNMDASLEESSRVSGASNLTTLFRITTPLMTPAIVGIAFLVFLFQLASFESERFLLIPKGVYVFSTYIWDKMSLVPTDYAGAMATANVFLFITAAVIFAYFKVVGKRQYVTVSGRGFAARPIDLGRWRWAAFGFVCLYLAVGFLTPFVLLMLGTFQHTFGIPATGYTLKHWREAFGDPLVMRSIKNTVFLGVGVASLSTVIHGLLSYASLRTKLKGRKVVDALTWVPRMSPGIVLAVGFVWALLGGIPGIKFLYGSLILMIIVVAVEATPNAMRLLNGGMVQLSMELEESARVSGASWLRTVRAVVLPLLLPTFLTNWLLTFAAATRVLVLLLFVYDPDSKVMAIDIFEKMQSSEMEQAAVMGVVLTFMTMGVALLARLVVRRFRGALAQSM